MFTKNLERQKYATTFRRGNASMIDVCIVMILRVLTLHLIGIAFMNRLVLQFTADFHKKFGQEVNIEANAEHSQFFMNHQIFYYIILSYIIVILVGALYHALLNSSSWQATVGKRLLGIMITNSKDETKISFWKAFGHYFLSVLPMVYVIYLFGFLATFKMTLYEAITASLFNFVIGMATVIWVQWQIISKKRTTVYDMICKTIFTNGRTDFKYPILEFQLKKYAKKI